jgi:hypothetical protein
VWFASFETTSDVHCRRGRVRVVGRVKRDQVEHVDRELESAESHPPLRAGRSRPGAIGEPLEVFDDVEDLHGGDGRRARREDERDREEFVIGKDGAHPPSLLPRTQELLSTPRSVSLVSNPVVGRSMLTKQSVKALNRAASGAIRITVVRATPSSRAMAR